MEETFPDSVSPVRCFFMISLFLWSYCCSVASAYGAPIAGVLREREFGGEILIDIDAEAGGLVYVHVAVFHCGVAGEDFFCFIAEPDAFLNSEVRNRKVQVCVGGVAYRRDVAGAVPCRADVEPFT